MIIHSRLNGQKSLTWRLDEAAVEEVIGDMHELYIQWVNRLGVNRAKALYWSTLAIFTTSPLWIVGENKKESKSKQQATFMSIRMLSNYVKIAWRNLLKNKVSSFINIGGLAVGMAVAMLIALWIYDELPLINTIKIIVALHG